MSTAPPKTIELDFGKKTMILEKTRFKRAAKYAYCPTCKYFLDGSPYWSLASSAAMHLSGIGHRVGLYEVARLTDRV